MNKLVVNEQTGFLESIAPSQTTFTSAKKLKFLELASEIAERGEVFKVRDLCKAVGINWRTFYEHLAEDTVFKQAWEDVLSTVEDDLVSTMVANGKKPGGYMDRITWLRAYRPERWNPDLKVRFSQDNGLNKKLSDALPGYIDAEVVETSPKAQGSVG